MISFVLLTFEIQTREKDDIYLYKYVLSYMSTVYMCDIIYKGTYDYMYMSIAMYMAIYIEAVYNFMHISLYISIYVSLYYEKISPVPPPCQESRGGREGGIGRIILSPPKARKFWVCLKFGFVRSMSLLKFGFVRSSSLFDFNDAVF